MEQQTAPWLKYSPDFDKWFKGYLKRIREERINPPPPKPPLSAGLMAAAARHQASNGTTYQREIDELAIYENGGDGREIL